MSADHPTTLTTRVANRAPGSRSGRRYLPEVDGHPVQALDPLLDGGCDANNSGGPIWQPIIFFGLAIVLAWRWRDWTPLVLVALAEGGALAIAEVGKDVIGRARPPESDAVPPFETSPSFPSAHTSEAFVIATMLTYLLVRHVWDRSGVVRILIGVVAFVYAWAMGFSRVFLGYHWRVPDALRDDLGEPLVGVLEHAHLLLLHPRDARPDALEALGSAGWGREAIVTWSQLVSFVAFRARVVAGLAVLAGKES